jgi:hypothetical protein
MDSFVNLAFQARARFSGRGTNTLNYLVNHKIALNVGSWIELLVGVP